MAAAAIVKRINLAKLRPSERAEALRHSVSANMTVMKAKGK